MTRPDRFSTSGLTGKAVKALSVFGGTQVAGILCSVARTKLIAIWIGPIGVALFAIYNSVIEMMAGVTQLSMRQTAVRDVAQASPALLPSVAASVRWWGRWLGLIGAAAMLALSPLLSFATFGHAGHWGAFAILAACMIFSSMAGSEQAIMQGAGRLSALAKSILYSSVAGTLLSLPLLYAYGAQGIVPSLILFALAGLVCSAWLCKVKGAPQPSAISRNMGRGFLRLGLAMTIATFASSGSSYAFLSYLTQTAGEEITGIYQAGYTITVKYVGLIFTALAMDYYPRLAAMCHNRAITSRFISHQASLLMCVMAPMIVVFVCADALFLKILYSDKFTAALPMMAIAIGGVTFRAISYCYAYLIVAKGDGKYYIATEVGSSIIGLALNILGFRIGGLLGVGVSYVAWYAIYAVMCRLVCLRRYNVDISRKAWTIALAAILIAAAAIALRPLGWWPPLTLLLPCALLAAYSLPRK